MEKNRVSRVILFVALCILIVGISIGFAAWSASLIIDGGSVVVSQGNSDESFKNLLSFTNPQCVPTADATVTSAGTLDSVNQTWSGAQVTLSRPGDSVTCTSTVQNASSFIAYLKSIDIEKAISCTNTTAGQSVEAACNSLKLTVSATMGSKTSTATAQGDNVVDALDIKESGIPAKIATVNGEGTISFKIEYVSGGTLSDADFVATIPQMTFVLNTLD